VSEAALDIPILSARQPSVKQKLNSIMESIHEFTGCDTENSTEIQKIKRKYDSKMVESGFLLDYGMKTSDVIKSNDECSPKVAGLLITDTLE